jgi:cell division protein FtsW (lipid II flippase)
MDPSIYRLRRRDILSFCVLALLSLGVLMVQSASMNVTGDVAWKWTPLGIKQFGFCFVALATFLVIGRIDYARFGRPTKVWWNHPVVWFVAITVVLNVLVLVPHVGIAKNGARRCRNPGSRSAGTAARWERASAGSRGRICRC